jgi:metal-responsive CopG/Arc/MetJ family transcriptional regulator
VPEPLVGELDSHAKQHGWSRSEAVTRAIRGLLGRPKRSAKD